jgi:hypothetical protein
MAGILGIVILGMFIPFSGVVLLFYGLSLSNLILGFVLFLVFFGVELGVVIIFFKAGGKRATAEVERLKPKQ